MPITPEGQVYRDALRGDCHLHSTWSDGGATIEAMAATAIASATSTWCSPTTRPASPSPTASTGSGCSQQLAIDRPTLNESSAPFRILTGMEVDILEDGSLDLADDLLARLDVVVASVHSKLRMERTAMTERMVRAVAVAARRHPRPLHRAG